MLKFLKEEYWIESLSRGYLGLKFSTVRPVLFGMLSPEAFQDSFSLLIAYTLNVYFRTTHSPSQCWRNQELINKALYLLNQLHLRQVALLKQIIVVKSNFMFVQDSKNKSIYELAAFCTFSANFLSWRDFQLQASRNSLCSTLSRVDVQE